MCSYPLQRADMPVLVRGYLVGRICRVRQGKSTPHPCWMIKRTQTNRNLNSTKNWGLLVLALLSIRLHSAWSPKNSKSEPWTAVIITSIPCSNFNNCSSCPLHLELIVSLHVSVHADTMAKPSLGFFIQIIPPKS